MKFLSTYATFPRKSYFLAYAMLEVFSGCCVIENESSLASETLK